MNNKLMEKGQKNQEKYRKNIKEFIENKLKN